MAQNFDNKQELRIVVNSKYGATKEAAESLIAQLDSQSKLSTPRRKNRKIRHKNEILKAKEHAPKGQKLKVFRLVPKNITQNLSSLSL
jgi:hypothetical protein